MFIIGNLSSAKQRSFKQIFYELHLVTLFYLTLQDFFLQSIVIIITAFIGLFLTGTQIQLHLSLSSCLLEDAVFLFLLSVSVDCHRPYTFSDRVLAAALIFFRMPSS